MTSSARSESVIVWLTWGVLALLFVIVMSCVIGALGNVDMLAELLPVLSATRRQLAVVAMAFGVCVAVALVATGVLIGFIRADRIFSRAALRWVDVLVGAAAAGTIAVFVALFFIPGPPQLFLLAEAGLLAGGAATLVLVFMRALLRRAVAMRVELDEVV